MAREAAAEGQASKQSILKAAKKGKGAAKKKKVKLEVAYDDRGVEKKGETGPQWRSRGRQTAGQGQRAATEQAGAAKPKYTAPTTLKGRRLKREEEDKVRDQAEELEGRLANEKHTVKSYYDLDTPAAVKRGLTGIRNPDAKTLEDLGATAFDKDRCDALAAPVDKGVQKALLEAKAKKDAGLTVFDKQLQIAEKLEKKNRLDFADYVDRDVPHIRADTGEFSTSVKTSKGLAAFETRSTNKLGLFEALAKEQPGDAFAVQQAKEKLAKLAVTDGRYGHRELRMTDAHLPEYMKVARRAQLEKGAPAGNKARMTAYRKAMNDNVVQQLGLKNHVPFAAPEYLNLRDLRDLENRSAA